LACASHASGSMKLITAIVAAFVISTTSAFGQQGEVESQRPSDALQAAKATVLDPTTWAPATLWYVSSRLDWSSSQVFFRNGFVEGNRFYTVSGLPNDIPVSYQVGKQRIFTTALVNTELSLANNWTSYMLERMLIRRYPEHGKLIKTLSVIERISFASYQTYRLGTIVHFQQWQNNNQLAQQLGIR
jgi:hypothetical protein